MIVIRRLSSNCSPNSSLDLRDKSIHKIQTISESWSEMLGTKSYLKSGEHNSRLRILYRCEALLFDFFPFFTFFDLFILNDLSDFKGIFSLFSESDILSIF
nr:MAG TPA: hypothetical protein [Caudoviricetes sp.]